VGTGAAALPDPDPDPAATVVVVVVGAGTVVVVVVLVEVVVGGAVVVVVLSRLRMGVVVVVVVDDEVVVVDDGTVVLVVVVVVVEEPDDGVVDEPLAGTGVEATTMLALVQAPAFSSVVTSATSFTSERFSALLSETSVASATCRFFCVASRRARDVLAAEAAACDCDSRLAAMTLAYWWAMTPWGLGVPNGVLVDPFATKLPW
jgi:hypothetical protein